jgi:uncharacterized protein (TIGR02145 family)
MKAVAIFMISVLLTTNLAKSQTNNNQSSSVNAVIERIGTNTGGILTIPASESVFPVLETNLSAEPAMQIDTVSDTETANYDPVITVEPGFLLQSGNYLGSCAPPMTYVVHGRYLTENLVIYDIFDGSAFLSLTGQNDYVSTLTLVPVNGIVDTTIYVRHCPGFYDNHTYLINSSSGIGAGLEVETDPIAGNAPVTRIGKVQAEPGTTISVPLKVTGMEYMNYIKYVIEFNPTVLTFQDWEDPFMYWIKSTSVIEINPELSQLIIEMESPSDNYITIVDNENILELTFIYSSGSTALNFGECSFRNFFNLFPNDEPASEYYFDGSVGSSIKSTTVLLNLEGFYNPDLEKMNQAMGESGAYFSGEVSDQISVKLYSESASYSCVYELDSINVTQDGHCVFKVPAIYSGSYYLAVSHRNSIETWSAIPVSFNDSVVQYDFTTSNSQAYGNNLKQQGDEYSIYAGDVNQDGNIDTGDLTPVENQAFDYSTGYLPADVNGDGMVDTWDMTFIDNNSRNFIGKVFPASDSLPVLTTDSINSITIYSAICHGSIIDQGSSQLTARGVCWDTSPEPDISGNHTVESGWPGFFESSFTGLAPNTLYYIRTYASNNEGTSYGNEISFNSAVFSPGEGVTDIDNNYYSTVIIGYQEWMAENLNVTRYRNGDSIPNITDNNAWSNYPKGAFCWYNNDEATYSNIYGALYNWNTVIDTRGLCPMGWHIPTDIEWGELITNYLGGANVADEKMKSTIGWNDNYNGNNSSGFSGLPGGYRNKFPFLSFGYIGTETGWWSSNEQHIMTSMSRYITNGGVYRISKWKNSGLSVRCLKDSAD